MITNIHSNVRTLSSPEKSFYTEMQGINRPVTNLSLRYQQNKIEEVLFRKDDYNFAITTLNCSRKNNLAVTGGSGVGKTAFIHFLTKYIPSILPDYTLAEINIASLISGCAYRGEFEKKLTGVIELAIAYKAIVYFDEAHALSMTGGVSSGGIDALNILKPHLISDFRCIMSTTTKESDILRNDVAFSRRFRFLELQPLDFKFKREIVIAKFGNGDIINNYLNGSFCLKKELHEMIDDVDFLISTMKIKSIENEVHFK